METVEQQPSTEQATEQLTELKEPLQPVADKDVESVDISIPLAEDIFSIDTKQPQRRMAARFMPDTYFRAPIRASAQSVHIADVTISVKTGYMVITMYKNRVYYNKNTKRINVLSAREMYMVNGARHTKTLYRISVPSDRQEDLRQLIVMETIKTLDTLASLGRAKLNNQVVTPNENAAYACSFWAKVRERHSIEKLASPIDEDQSPTSTTEDTSDAVII